MVIACLVQGFFPSEPVTVTWNPSKDGASVRNFPPVKSSSGSLYTMTSQLTLPANQCPDDASLECSVQHDSSTSQTVPVRCRGRGRLGRGRGLRVLTLTQPLELPWDKSGLPG